MSFSPFIIIENLPKGTYGVEELEIVSGSNVLTIRNDSLFNRITLHEPGNYYLGSYMTKKIPPLMGLNFQVTKTKNDGKEKIYKQLKKKSTNWTKLKIDFGMCLFEKDISTIEI